VKVLALIPDYIENPSGGLGEQFRNLYNCLKDRVEYSIVGYPEKNSLKNYKAATTPFPFKHGALTTIYGQSIYFLKSLEFKTNFDIIHAFDWSTFYAGWLCKQIFKKPLICTINLSLKHLNSSGIHYCHDINSPDGKAINELQLTFEEMGLYHANKVIQVSNYYKELFPLIANKTVVIENGIDIEKWTSKRNVKLPGKNRLKFCYIGRASHMKGLNTILDCNLPDDIDFYFVVSEKNADISIYKKIREKVNNKNIFHIPGLYGQDKIDFLLEMDGVVMPSIHEPFGIVALEALISNCLFISTGTGGIGDIVNGIDWFKIENKDDLLHTFNIVKKLSEKDISLIKQKGRAKALKYSWANSAEKLYETYLSLDESKSVIEFY
jgi:glycosyltransferase involved in cell wall biosynthesis